MAKTPNIRFRHAERFGMLCLIILVLFSLTKNSKNTSCFRSLSKLTGTIQVPILQDDDTPMVDDSLPIDWGNISQSNNTWLDIAVPVAGSENSLLQLAKTLGDSMAEFRRNVKGNYTVRLLVTRYPAMENKNGTYDEALRKMLLRLSKVDLIQFVSVNFTEFHRAQAINALHQNACHMENCVLAITDVDLDILPGFLIHALSYVTPKTIYFPIVFCLARPSSILFMEALLGPLPKFSPEKGFWEKYGHGMYAMSGSDVLNLTMGDQFKGWGLEDDDFFERAQKAEFRIVRLKEHNLIHRWHPKICKLGVTVHGDIALRNW